MPTFKYFFRTEGLPTTGVDCIQVFCLGGGWSDLQCAIIPVQYEPLPGQ